ncbi:hypothetical protein LQZ18_08940 [Lachnospiraceae bacterium ZAX-1]
MKVYIKIWHCFLVVLLACSILLLSACASADRGSDISFVKETKNDAQSGTQNEDFDVEQKPKSQIVTYQIINDSIRIGCSFDDPVLGERENGETAVSINGLANVAKESGLPFLSVVLALPHNTNISDADWEWGEIVHIPDVKRAENKYAATEEGKGSSKEQPLQDVRVKYKVRECKGYRILYLNIYPVAYGKDSEELFFSNEISVNLPLTHYTWVLTKSFEQSDIEEIKSMVDNPEDVSTNKLKVIS